MLENLDYNINRLLSGKTLCEIDGQIFWVQQPDYENLLYINHRIKIIKGELSGVELLSQDDLFNYLIDNDFWTIEKQNRVDTLPNDINETKIALYNAYQNFKPRDKLRKKISLLKKELQDLLNERHFLDEITMEGYINFIKSTYLIGLGTYNEQGQRLWNTNSLLLSDFLFLSKLTTKYSEQILSDEKLRQIAKSPQWKSIWSLNKNPISYFNDEQKNLLAWSQLYDNIYGSPECPDDEVIEDDDMLDGWLLVQQQKRKQDKLKANADKYGSSKGGHQDIFVVVENPDDVKRVEELNDPKAKILKRKVSTRWKQTDLSKT